MILRQKKSVIYIEIHSQYVVKILTEWRKEQSKISHNTKTRDTARGPGGPGLDVNIFSLKMCDYIYE